jgi:hypothetical protein
MANDQAKLGLQIRNDRSGVVLTIFDGTEKPLAHVNLDAQQLRQFLATTIHALQHIEGPAPPPSMTPGQTMALPLPTTRPQWRVGRLPDGDPILASEMYPGHWSSFSLSPDDGLKLAETLTNMVMSARSKN